MSAPEIHIEKTRDAKEPSRKRRRSSSSKAEKKNAVPAADAPTKRSLLSKDTSSFRYLFSFGDGGGDEKSKGSDVEGQDRDEAPAPVPGSIFAKLEIAAARAGGNEVEDEQAEVAVEKMEVEVVHDEDYYEAEPVAEPVSEPVYVVKDGLAADSHEEVLAMAKRFCGVDMSVEDLEREWTEGGRREALREDLRSKRHKRIRGRVLGANAGTKQVY